MVLAVFLMVLPNIRLIIGIFYSYLVKLSIGLPILYHSGVEHKVGGNDDDHKDGADQYSNPATIVVIHDFADSFTD